MAADDQPTLAELLRRLESLTGQLLALTSQIREDRSSVDRTFLRKETYDADRRADERRFRELEQDNKNQADFRRQMLAGVTLLFITTVVGIVLTLSGLK